MKTTNPFFISVLFPYHMFFHLLNTSFLRPGKDNYGVDTWELNFILLNNLSLIVSKIVRCLLRKSNWSFLSERELIPNRGDILSRSHHSRSFINWRGNLCLTIRSYIFRSYTTNSTGCGCTNDGTYPQFLFSVAVFLSHFAISPPQQQSSSITFAPLTQSVARVTLTIMKLYILSSLANKIDRVS